MTTDLIRYDLLVQDALRSVVRRVLGDAQRDGLPGEHHFYVSFRTDKAGVRISPRLRERYPQDMTIVLQHQFDNLVVHDHAFEVGLSFSGVAERLRVPFDALSGFFDPSVQFGLKFEASEAETAAEPAVAPAEAEPPAPTAIPTIGARKDEGGKGKAKAASARKSKEAPEGAPAEEPAAGGGEVVSLDAFRRKS